MSKHAITLETPGFKWFHWSKRSRVCVSFEADRGLRNGKPVREAWCQHYSYADTAGRNYRKGRHSVEDETYQAFRGRYLAVMAIQRAKGFTRFTHPVTYIYMWVTEDEFTSVRERWRDVI